jgi:predicted membrane-bound dolichyl-phosphate-mannose-protein mannosyltransferase
VLAPDNGGSQPSETRWNRIAKYSAAIALIGILAACLLLAVNASSASPLAVDLAEVFSGLALLSGVVALATGLEHLVAVKPKVVMTLLTITVITAAVLMVHFYVINAPPVPPGQSCAITKQGCVGDESYYASEALRILNGEPCSTNGALTPNCHLEHPFLAKAMMALGMAIFGVNAFGLRFFIVILGTLCIPLLFVLVLQLSKNRKFALFSCLLLAADTLFFTQSSIGMLEIPSVFFGMLAFVLYFWPKKVWKIDNYVAAGVAMGLAVLCKETAVFMALALLSYHAFTRGPRFRSMAVDALKMLLPAGVVFVVGLQVYASLFTTATTPNFISEIAYIFSYGSGLHGCDQNWIDPVLHRCATPFDWLVFYTPSSWFSSVVNVTTTSGGTSVVQQYVDVAFYKMTNPIVVWLLFAWVPLIVAVKVRRKPEGYVESPDDRTAVFMLFWFVWTWLPYVVLWSPLVDRTVYPFYILSAVPALAAGSAYFVTREWFPSRVAIVYTVAAFGWFLLYFPMKDFLPVWLRILLGR